MLPTLTLLFMFKICTRAQALLLPAFLEHTSVLVTKLWGAGGTEN
jgi:hypothetical protein